MSNTGRESCLALAKRETIKLILHQVTGFNYADQKEVLPLLQSLVCHWSSLWYFAL